MDPYMMPYGLHDDLRLRLEKLTRAYDMATMKIFMAVESQGDNNVYNTYAPERREFWETFLIRREACRLDLARHETTREKYEYFLAHVNREEQGKQFFHSIISLLKSKGAVDIFRQTSSKSFLDLESTFCGHLCRLFDKKLDTWFDNFEAVNVKLTAHVKVSNLVRVLTGQVDLICRKGGILYAINIKVTGMPTPRPMDVCELCLVKAMVIQNGLADPEDMICGLLVCHLGEDRPVLRLWEYRPTKSMDTAIKEADVDSMIDAGKLSKLHELWPQNLCPPGVASLTAREALANNPAPPKYTDMKPTNENYFTADKPANESARPDAVPTNQRYRSNDTEHTVNTKQRPTITEKVTNQNYRPTANDISNRKTPSIVESAT